MLVPNRQIITITPGRNHCNGDAPLIAAGLTEPANNGPKSPRKTNGWTSEKIMENGSRRISEISRWKTCRVSATNVVMRPPHFLPPRADFGR